MDQDVTFTSVNCPFLKKPKVDLSFKNLTYEVKKINWKKPFVEKKQLLHGVNGEFRSGELTAIMGPSGAGKSTLLNVLAGYKIKGVKGNIYINNQKRSNKDTSSFKSLSAYILQDDYLRDYLTVEEAMNMATELKLGRNVSSSQKRSQIKELLNMLGLEHCLKTLTGGLSGGQRKRLSIAFELITNPPIIFLDEPTTGLDSSSCSQCVSLLKMLAEQGRTIICTIHQPSALIFEMFSKVYALANGYCIYDGTIKDLVPYLSEKGLKCPVYHNPADYLLEVACGEYGPVVDQLYIKSNEVSNAIQSEEKEIRSTKFQLKNLKISDIKHCIKHQTAKEDNSLSIKPHSKDKRNGYKFQLNQIWTNNFLYQFCCLYSINLVIFQKEYKYRIGQFLSHTASAILLGFLFQGTGNNASMIRSNLNLILGVLLFIMVTGKLPVTTTISKELKILKVQHFNRWYSLLPYYLSLIIIEIPMQIFNCIPNICILYYISDQPFDLFRFTYFQIFCITTTLTAQSIGFFLGSWVPIKIAIFMGPIVAATCCGFGFTIKLYDRFWMIQWASFLSYFRSAFYGIATVLYGFDRKVLNCPDLYCHFKTPTKILDELGMNNVDIYSNLAFIIVIAVLMHCATFSILYVKLNKR